MCRLPHTTKKCWNSIRISSKQWIRSAFSHLPFQSMKINVLSQNVQSFNDSNKIIFLYNYFYQYIQTTNIFDIQKYEMQRDKLRGKE